MRALTVEAQRPASARLEPWPDPSAGHGEVQVETMLVGVCGTDREILSGAYGEAPPGADRLVLGHEAAGRVVTAPATGGLSGGDLVVPIVRRPDPAPCESCAVGEWDMCRNGRYTEHGIKALHGFARDRFATDPAALVHVPDGLGDLAVLVEPGSVVAKAWEQIDRIVGRSHRQLRTALVTGAGPVGLLASLIAVHRGLAVHVLDRVTDGPKPDLVTDLGATYHTGPIASVRPIPDVIVECTGVGSLVLDACDATAPVGIVCLAGLSSGARTIELDAAALNRRMVLENDVVFGTVNANRRHYLAAAEVLAAADRSWLSRLITRRVPLERWEEAMVQQVGDVKVVLEVNPTTTRS